MREFEKYEMFKTKCPVCGCKNKVHTELMNINNKFVGYLLKCCNCGNYNQFLLDHTTNGKEKDIPYKNGIERCIQPSYCPKKDCPLYGTCTVDNNDVEFKPVTKLENSDELDHTVSVDVFNMPRFL